MVAPTATPPGDSLWRDRAFGLFWLARAVSLAGSTLTTVVLPLLVFRLTGSALQTSLLAALTVVPYLAFGLVAGALADRVDRKRLMIGCYLLNAALLGSLPLAALLDALTLPQIYAVHLLAATSFVWFDAANFGALPAIVGRERIVAANSAIWSTSTVVQLAGPAIAGALAALLDPALVIGLDVASYLLAAVVLTAIARPFNVGRADPPPAGSLVWRTVVDIREGLRYLWGQRLVRALTLLGFGNSFTGGAVTGLLVVYGVRALGLRPDDARLGTLFTAGAVGALAASLALPRLTARFPIGRITLLGLGLNPLLLLGVALAPAFGAGLALYALWQACYTLVIINGIAIRQQVIPDHLQSRVNATARMIAWGGAPFGAAVGGVLAESASVRVTYVVMALGVALSAALGWFSPLRESGGAGRAPAAEAAGAGVEAGS